MSPLLVASRPSNVELESQVSDDRDALVYIPDHELPPSSFSTPRTEDSAHNDKGVKGPAHHHDDADLAQRKDRSKSVSWSALPKKDQLFILTLARLAEPVVQTSLGSYMFFMLRSFDESLPNSAISSQAGILAGSFTFAQCLTAVFWGRLADKCWMGRKNVLVVGLVGTFISCLGFGFSRSFVSAMLFRCLGGALNGNVGVMRTMISEIIVEKRYQTRAFLVMPVTFNCGVLIGPLLGGWLQDPVHTFPKAFGPGSTLGGKDGVRWMSMFPYALPNMVSAMFLLVSVLIVLLGLEETHVERRFRTDRALEAGRAIARAARVVFCRRNLHKYTRLNCESYDEEGAHELRGPQERQRRSKPPSAAKAKLPYRRIFTRNVICTFLVHGLLAGHLGAFHNLWFLFLSTPRYDPKHPNGVGHAPQRFPFHFTGGLGLPPSTIGFALGIIGAIGLCMQFGVYSRITDRYGTLNTYRHALLLFPIAYSMVPFLVMLPTKSDTPHPSDGPWLWIGISSLLLVVVAGRTFSLPITQILVNNCSPHPSVLSSVHGLGQSVSAGARTLGPVVWSTLYGLGLHKGYVGLGFWTLCVESILAFGASWLVYEGNGHEIRLPSDA